ncbi:MAG: V-type ATP synthase subunit D [Chlamydiota bacterium]
MAVSVKLTKSGLRSEQEKLFQLQKYLPTLQLKKAMLQLEFNNVCVSLQKLEKKFSIERKGLDELIPLLGRAPDTEVLFFTQVESIQKRYENLAGVEVPVFEGVTFPEETYSLFSTPMWMDTALDRIKNVVKLREEIRIQEEKKYALEKELLEVSIRVNLFEKILIPRSLGNIRKIRIFLGDQALSAVAQSKVAKQKIFAKKEKRI